MNGAQVMASGGLVSGLGSLLVWVTHWPLQPMDTATALGVAGLVITLAGMIWHWGPTSEGTKP